MSRRKRSTQSPTQHTILIERPVQMWEKLAWDVEVFDEIQRSYPDERQPISYAALNVCLAAQSLHGWVTAHYQRQGKRHDPQTVYQAVKGQRLCEAVANTSKHATFEERNWTKGTLSLAWEDGDEDVPSGFMLYASDDVDGLRLVHSTFLQVKEQWWHFLVSAELTDGARATPEWLNLKLIRIFGDPSERTLPPGASLTPK